MRNRVALITGLLSLILLSACTAYESPWLSLSLKSVYTSSDIKVYYTYVCEEEDQRCVCSLYETSNPTDELFGLDAVLSKYGVLDFSELGLGEGDYRLDFKVYSENDGEYSLLKFLDESYEFSIAFP